MPNNQLLRALSFIAAELHIRNEIAQGTEKLCFYKREPVSITSMDSIKIFADFFATKITQNGEIQSASDPEHEDYFEMYGNMINVHDLPLSEAFCAIDRDRYK